MQSLRSTDGSFLEALKGQAQTAWFSNARRRVRFNYGRQLRPGDMTPLVQSGCSSQLVAYETLKDGWPSG